MVRYQCIYSLLLFILVKSDGAEQIEPGATESSSHESKGELVVHRYYILLIYDCVFFHRR